ncbi:MAG: tripartite tricarboxylate transporter substrate binding protein [Pseudomonadota bacterium]
MNQHFSVASLRGMRAPGRLRPSATRRLLAAAAVMALMPPALHAQGKADLFPEHPLKLVVPFPPGGATDLLARAVAEGLRGVLDQPVVVDNRGGAGGLIGTELVVAAPADGYTLLLTSLNNHIMMPLIQKTKFNPERDLASVGLAAQANTVVLTSNATPAKTLGQFVDYARHNPGSVNYSSSGNGSFGHFFTELFKSQAHIPVTHVPYKGAAPSVMALVSNEVQLLVVAYSAVQSNAEAGQVRVLAQDGATRSALLPNVPTLAEAGFGNFQPTFWLGVSAPKNTPPAIIAKLNRALNTVLASQAFQETARKSALTPLPGAPAAMDSKVAADLRQYGPVVQKLNIKPD